MIYKVKEIAKDITQAPCLKVSLLETGGCQGGGVWGRDGVGGWGQQM